MNAEETFDRRSWTLSIEDWFSQHPTVLAALQLLPLIAAAAYGFGWVFVNRIFAEFGVTSEEVGIDSGWLIVRSVAGVLVISFIGLLALYMYGIVKASRFNPVLEMSLSGFDSGKKIIRWKLRIFIRSAAAAVTAFILTCILIFPFFYAAHVVEQVKKGQDFRLYAPPGVIAMRIDRVTVWPISTEAHIPGLPLEGTCLLRLGFKEGTSVFYDSANQKTIRLNDQNIGVRFGC